MKRRDRKPNIQQFMAAKVAAIRKACTIPMRITIIVRNPAHTELEAIVSDDNFDQLIECMQRRRDAVVASQGSVA